MHVYFIETGTPERIYNILHIQFFSNLIFQTAKKKGLKGPYNEQSKKE